MQTNFLDISYLKKGTSIQQRAYELLTRYSILSVLSSYSPILVGTIPIGIDVAGSDLDIVCEIKDVTEFEKYLVGHFGRFEQFKLKRKEKNLIVCSFYIEEMEVEIYATDTPSTSSNGYRHILIEHRLLKLFGQEFKKQVIILKNSGIKTEPAFGQLLGLKNNPYEELLQLENYMDSDLLKLWEVTRGL